MKPIAEMTDLCLKNMKPGHLYCFEDWWEKILGLDALPNKKTYDYMKWSTCTRGKVYQQINRELALRKVPDRLEAVGNGKGIFRLNVETVASYKIDKRVRSLMSKIECTMSDWNALSHSAGLSPSQIRMLNASTDWMQMSENMMLGTLAKLPIAKETKSKLLKRLSAGPNGKRKNRNA